MDMAEDPGALDPETTSESRVGDTEHRLATDDAVTFRSAMPNRWENVGTAPAGILIVVARPRS